MSDRRNTRLLLNTYQGRKVLEKSDTQISISDAAAQARELGLISDRGAR